MADELDPLLLREFGRSQQLLADTQFVAQVRKRLPAFSARRLLAGALSGVIRAIFTGLSFGVVAPLRMRHAGLVMFAALGVALWSILGRSR